MCLIRLSVVYQMSVTGIWIVTKLVGVDVSLDGVVGVVIPPICNLEMLEWMATKIKMGWAMIEA